MARTKFASNKKKPIHVPPALRKQLQNVSRQQRYQMIRLARGLCAGCGREPLVGKLLGARCAKKQRERIRLRKGFSARKGAK